MTSVSISELRNKIAFWNHLSWLALAIESGFLLLFIAIIDWPLLLRNTLLIVVAIGVVVGPFTMSRLKWLMQKKTRIERLKESTRFGIFHKHLLTKLYREVMNKLQIADHSLPLYIVADRSFNAMAVHWGIGSVFAFLNGIVLNRQVLYHLTEDEVKDLIGHELGHYYRHFIVSDRFLLVHLVFDSLLTIWLIQLLGLDGFFGYLILMVTPSGLMFLQFLPHSFCSHAIEYLCDATGGEVAGVLNSIQGLLKIGIANEIEQEVFYQIIASEQSERLDSSELIETIVSNVPYGYESKEEVEGAVSRAMKRKIVQSGPSLSGLLRYMWNSDNEEQAKEELQEHAKLHRKLQLLDRLRWEDVLDSPRRIILDEGKALRLVAMIQEHPNKPMFRLLSEVHEKHSLTHPTLRNRILFLWNNRREIEQGIRR